MAQTLTHIFIVVIFVLTQEIDSCEFLISDKCTYTFALKYNITVLIIIILFNNLN